jgi:hypothetical protein
MVAGDSEIRLRAWLVAQARPKDSITHYRNAAAAIRGSHRFTFQFPVDDVASGAFRTCFFYARPRLDIQSPAARGDRIKSKRARR